MAIYLDFTGVVNAAQTIVADFGPDYVYGKCEGMCVYFDEDDKPSCLVGRILDTYGVTVESIRDRGFNETTVAVLFDSDLVDADQATRLFLTRLQSDQDAGIAWGKALTRTLGLAVKDMHDTIARMRDLIRTTA